MRWCWLLTDLFIAPALNSCYKFQTHNRCFFLDNSMFPCDRYIPLPAVPLLYRAKGDFYLINVHYWNHVNFFYQITIILKKCYSYKELSHFDVMVDIRKPNRLIHWCSWVSIFVVIVKSTFSRKCIIRGQWSYQ